MSNLNPSSANPSGNNRKLQNGKIMYIATFWHYLLNIAQTAKYVFIFVLLAPMYLEEVFSVVSSFAEFM